MFACAANSGGGANVSSSESRTSSSRSPATCPSDIVTSLVDRPEMYPRALPVASASLMDYPTERFTNDERRLLEPHFTNLDRPVFCVVNLPEVVKGALFARYSRYHGTLRRLYLEEFTEEEGQPVRHPAGGLPPDGSHSGSERAEALYQRVFLEFGDDS